MLNTFDAEQLPPNTPVVLCHGGQEVPAIFIKMDWAIGDDEPPRRRASITIEGEGVLVPAWWLRVEEG